MHNDHASTKRIVLTLVGWGAGLLAIAGLMVAVSTAIAPKTPSDKAPAAESTATAALTASVAATLVAPPTPAITSALAPLPVPTPEPTRTALPVKPLAGKVVVIDPGHQAKGDSSLEPIGPGSSDKKPKVSTGSSGVQTHNPESLINLQVALELQDELVRLGADVRMVRTRQTVNVSNSKRASIANEADADLFIRLHCDGNVDRSMEGLSTLVPKPNKWTEPIVAESKKAGQYVHKAVIARAGAKDRGVVNRGDLSGFNWAKVPTVLVEMGFLSNRGEDVKLGTTSYQQALASGLASGIETYLTAE